MASSAATTTTTLLRLLCLSTVLNGTNLTVVFQDTKCSGFAGTIQAGSFYFSLL
jgi:hypothetical protein